MIAADIPTTQTIPANVSLLLSPATFVHAGEGNTREKATVVLDAPVGLADVGLHQYFRVRSTGTTYVPGRRRVPPAKADNELRRLNLVYDRAGAATATPFASRTVELILRPVLPFQQAILSGGEVNIYDSLSFVDSFNSASSTASTSGLYDSAKRQQNGDVFANSASFRIDGRIYGDVGTTGGTLTSGGQITGTINNRFQQALSAVPVPAWSASIPTAVGTGTINLTAGSAAAPARYKFSDFTGTMTISSGGAAQNNVEVWLTGDLFGDITIAAGVSAKIYVQGNVWVNASSLDNRSRLAANLQIYGVQPAAGESRYFGVGLGQDLYASIYSPGHEVMFGGTGHIMGAVVGKTVNAYGRTYLHYDEALMLRGRTLDYKVASWIEVLR
jgi:hypothetical protein